LRGDVRAFSGFPAENLPDRSSSRFPMPARSVRQIERDEETKRDCARSRLVMLRHLLHALLYVSSIVSCGGAARLARTILA